MNTLLFLAILLPLPAQSEGDSARSQCLKVMTFNIRYGTAPDGDNSWTMRNDLAIQVIRHSSPDVIGLQEALRFQIDELRRAMPEYAELGVGRDDGDTTGEFSAILYRRAALRPDTGGTFWFSDTPHLPGSKTWGNRYPRVCTWAIFRSQESHKRVAVFNVHWDHESQPSRERSAELLMKTVGLSADEVPVILTGDFNSGEHNPAILSLKERFADSFRLIHPQDSLVGTFHAFLGSTTGEKIDHILVSPGISVTDAQIIRRAANGRYPSDHFPVTATVCLPRQ